MCHLWDRGVLICEKCLIFNRSKFSVIFQVMSILPKSTSSTIFTISSETNLPPPHVAINPPKKNKDAHKKTIFLSAWNGTTQEAPIMIFNYVHPYGTSHEPTKRNQWNFAWTYREAKIRSESAKWNYTNYIFIPTP